LCILKPVWHRTSARSVEPRLAGVFRVCQETTDAIHRIIAHFITLNDTCDRLAAVGGRVFRVISAFSRAWPGWQGRLSGPSGPGPGSRQGGFDAAGSAGWRKTIGQRSANGPGLAQAAFSRPDSSARTTRAFQGPWPRPHAFSGHSVFLRRPGTNRVIGWLNVLISLSPVAGHGGRTHFPVAGGGLSAAPPESLIWECILKF